MGKLTFSLPKNDEHLQAVEAILKRHCNRSILKNYRLFGGIKRADLLHYEYELKLKKEMNGWDLGNELKALENIQEVKLTFADTEESI